jgi:uncharacterized protein (TIGR03790 family)
MRTRPSNCLIAYALGISWSVLGFPSSFAGQSPDQVLVVVNQKSPASSQIGAYYMQQRHVPEANLVSVSSPESDEITRAEFEQQIQRPIAQWLGSHSAYDRILYIVLCKGIPLRIGGTSGRNGSVASVDSEISLLYRRLVGRPVSPDGRVDNPYFLGEKDIDQARTFTHETSDVYLVTRLDGFTVKDVMGLIDRGSSTSSDGVFVLDQKAGLDDIGNGWLQTAAQILSRRIATDRVVLDSTSNVVRDVSNVMGLYSWGSSDPAQTERRIPLTFAPGAIAATFVSTDARTFTEPPAGWKLGTWRNRASYYAGSPQSLTGDLIRAGVTGVAGHVAEPYLDGTVRPQILFVAYLAGFSLAESFYLALPYLSWQTVIVGDPLCAPFRKSRTSTTGNDREIDPDTELPVLFSRRRLEALAEKGLSSDALKLLLRGEARLAMGDRQAARQAFEDATNKDERLTKGHAYLAVLFEQAGAYDQAIERYRRILNITPNDVAALNNLAYALAVRKQAPVDALPLAERAHALDVGNPGVSDTLGWIKHLLGNHQEAATLLAEAVRWAPQSPEIRLHAAHAYVAVGQPEMAARELAKALELAPQLKTREDVVELQKNLTASRPP